MKLTFRGGTQDTCKAISGPKSQFVAGTYLFTEQSMSQCENVALQV